MALSSTVMAIANQTAIAAHQRRGVGSPSASAGVATPRNWGAAAGETGPEVELEAGLSIRLHGAWNGLAVNGPGGPSGSGAYMG
jgi:hypothetical protein